MDAVLMTGDKMTSVNSQEDRREHVGTKLDKMESVKDQKDDHVSAKSVRSVRTSSSLKTSASSTCSALMKQKAKAEAAKVRLQYALHEAELIKQEHDAKLKRTILMTECDVKEAEAELRVMEEMIEEQEGQSRSLGSEDADRRIAMEKVKEFLDYPSYPLDVDAQEFRPQPVTAHPPTTDAQEYRPRPVYLPTPDAQEYRPRPVYAPTPTPYHIREANPQDPDPLRLSPAPSIRTEQVPQHVMAELSKFMLKKDLIKERLSKFSDSPGSYLVWKTTFKTVMQELNVTPAEEIDLLMRHLGPTSSKYATTIRSANVHNPLKGLQRIWDRLEEEYGRPEVIQTYLTSKLTNFPKLTNKDSKRLFDLVDLLSEVEAIKENPSYASLLSYFDTSAGINPVLGKLPYNVQEKWVNEAVKYKKTHNVMFPPLSYFIKFVHRLAEVKNDPCFETHVQTNCSTPTHDSKQSTKPIACKKTEITQEVSKETTKICPIHNTNHSLNDCKVFRSKAIDERKTYLKEHGLCFKCCGTAKHLAKDCKLKTVTCGVCRSNRHPTGLHVEETTTSESQSSQGGEQNKPATNKEQTVHNRCTQLCGDSFHGRSCAKIVLVNVYPNGRPDLATKVYAMIDDQSNRSLAKSEFFDNFGEKGADVQYTLVSCSGQSTTAGRRASNYIIEAVDGSTKLKLPTLIECNQIPNSRSEIPTPDVAKEYLHLRDIADSIPPIDETAKILLLLGRDIVQVHRVFDQRVGPGNSPYGQKLSLGWVIIGEVCLGKVHRTQSVNVKKTYILNNGQPTLFPPCDNNFTVKECNLESLFCEPDSRIFLRTKDDNKLGKSAEDREFEKIMESEMCRNDEGNWEAPLPFRESRPTLPNNRSQASKRAEMLEGSLKRDPQKMEHFCQFMQNLFDKGFAEEAPPLPEHAERWYLPIFGVYHPKKPSQIRVVFDSSARYKGVSLNQVLLPGPNLTNDLLGVLMRFRLGQVAATADIQTMFYAFKVKKEHRDYLRFLWHKNNDINQELIEFRMTVHVFGNTTSPAIATYALRKTVEDSSPDVKNFVNEQFYVDDGLLATNSVDEAEDLLKRTQHDLEKKGKLRLHKIASNSVELMKQLASEDLAKELQSLSFTEEYLPFHQSLGLAWDLQTDSFTFLLPGVEEQKPSTRRGLLATINRVYDPIGFAAPVLIKGKMLLRQVAGNCVDWDEELTNTEEFMDWVHSLQALGGMRVPRAYATVPLTHARKEIHIFCDASEKAISAVAYMKVVDPDGKAQTGFVLGKAKLAPAHGHSLPRLELCAAVLAVEIGETIQEALKLPTEGPSIKYYTDSRVVLGYINNRTRRFYTYVSNRVDRIRHSSKPSDWHHVSTDENPADLGTRSVQATNLQDSSWLTGPTFLRQPETMENGDEDFPLVEPDDDREVRPQLVCCKSSVDEGLGLQRFTRFSRWQSLVRAIGVLKKFVRQFKCKSTPNPKPDQDAANSNHVEQFIVKEAQREYYPQEIRNLQRKLTVPAKSPLAPLNPFLDSSGVMRVGGRLEKAFISYHEAHPIILPGKTHVAFLIVNMCHDEVLHQGRLATEGAVRSKGYWITGLKRLVTTLVRQCVHCRKLRGKERCQIMAPLPSDRLSVGPPFTNIGVDVFGPWEIVARKTRGSQGKSKRWAALFTCLSTRAIHIEVLEDMSTSSFINALRRMIALRGKVKLIRSDCGTNFVGAEKFLKDIEWIFNPPHSSHMGGVWERMIKSARKILDSMFSDPAMKTVTHEVLATLMAEVSAILNSRPITVVSTDPENPVVLSPALLLTHKDATNDGNQMTNDIDIRDIYRVQWKRVQFLSEMFWTKWKKEYLNTLQTRQKWTETVPDIKQGDIVLLKEKETERRRWPLGRISETIPSADGKIRKVIVTTCKDGKQFYYERPITELVLLVEA